MAVIIGGGPHINILTSSAAAGQWVFKISALMKPTLPVQFLGALTRETLNCYFQVSFDYLINYEMNFEAIRIGRGQFFELVIK